MVSKQNFVRAADCIWEIPRTFRDDMRVPARLYADEELLDAALADNSVPQLVNTATLPGVIGHAIAMPDIHIEILCRYLLEYRWYSTCPTCADPVNGATTATGV